VEPIRIALVRTGYGPGLNLNDHHRDKWIGQKEMASRIPNTHIRSCRVILALMTGATGLLIKLGVRLVVFGLVFFIATRKNPKVIVAKKRVLPLIALVFAVLNTGLYWALQPILNLATMGAAGFIMPFVINLALLIGTVKIFEKKKWLEVQGLMTTLWLSAFLTIAHGLLYVALDYLPAHA